MNSDKDGSNLVRTVRTWLGLTQEQFASRLGFTFAFVNHQEGGRVTPPRLPHMQIMDPRHELAAADEDILHEFFGLGTRPGEDTSPRGQ